MDNFIILEELGEGTFSKVYKVLRKNDSNIYAMKKVNILNLEQRDKQNALNEIRILASLNNENIIKYKEAFFNIENSCLCIIMEYADNGDLLQLIKSKKSKKQNFPEEFIRSVIVSLVEGLNELHYKQIIHRDLKPANIFLFTNGQSKLGDLNVSKVAKRGLVCTQTGTPYYASPEVWKDCPYDFKSDIWSLACVIYELTTLSPPFLADSMSILKKKVTKGKDIVIPKIYSDEIYHFIKWLLNIKSEFRPSCKEIIQSELYKNIKESVIETRKKAEFLNMKGYGLQLSNMNNNNNNNKNTSVIPNYKMHNLDNIYNYNNQGNTSNKNFNNRIIVSSLSVQRALDKGEHLKLNIEKNKTNINHMNIEDQSSNINKNLIEKEKIIPYDNNNKIKLYTKDFNEESMLNNANKNNIVKQIYVTDRINKKYLSKEEDKLTNKSLCQNNYDQKLVSESLFLYDTIKMPMDLNIDNFEKASNYLPKPQYYSEHHLNHNLLDYKYYKYYTNFVKLEDLNTIKNVRYNQQIKKNNLSNKYKHTKNIINDTNQIENKSKKYLNIRNNNLIKSGDNIMNNVQRNYKYYKRNNLLNSNEHLNLLSKNNKNVDKKIYNLKENLKSNLFNNIVYGMRPKYIRDKELNDFYKNIKKEVIIEDPLDPIRRMVKPHLYNKKDSCCLLNNNNKQQVFKNKARLINNNKKNNLYININSELSNEFNNIYNIGAKNVNNSNLVSKLPSNKSNYKTIEYVHTSTNKDYIAKINKNNSKLQVSSNNIINPINKKQEDKNTNFNNSTYITQM